MKLLLSVPSGFNARELLVPLKEHFEKDQAIAEVICITPAAPYRSEIFKPYGPKFRFVANPQTFDEHIALLQDLAPQIVVTCTAGLDPNDVYILQAAKQLNICTLTFIASWDNVYKMERLKKYGKPYVLANHFAVWNQMMRDHLLRVFPEVTQDQITITGPPRFDWFTHADRIPSKEALFNYLNIPNDGSKLVHIATTELYPMEYIVEAIVSGQRSGAIKDRLHLYASVHPGGNMAKHEGYAEKYDVTVRYSFGRREISPINEFAYNPTPEEIYMLVALFKHTDVLVNHSSTVAIESFFTDVPVVNVKYGMPWDWWRWRRSMVYRDFQQHYQDITAENGTTIVKNSRQLVEAVAQSLLHPEFKHAERAKTIQKMITVTDGTSSQRLWSLIKTHATTP